MFFGFIFRYNLDYNPCSLVTFITDSMRPYDILVSGQFVCAIEAGPNHQVKKVLASYLYVLMN